MANVEEVEAEYKSDSEEPVVPLAMRRREASDDDGEDVYGEAEYRERPFRIERTVGLCSDGESDGLGGAPEYDDEKSYIDEEDEFEKEEEDEFEEDVKAELQEFEEKVTQLVPVVQIKEKKESEAFVVPTVGAFYMHDDRFRNNGRGGRRRRTLGGRKLWQFNDGGKWRHDKFEDLALQQTRNIEFNTFIEESRTTEGHYRCSSNEGFYWGNVSRNQYRHHDKSNNQSSSSKVVRGRGPVKYKPLTMSNNVIPPTKNIQTRRVQEAMPNTISARVLLQISNKRDVQPASIGRCLPSSVMLEEKFSVPQSIAFLPGKTVGDSIGQNRLYLAEYSQSGVQRMDLPIMAQLRNQSTLSSNKVDRISSQKQHPVIQRRPIEDTVQHSLQVSTGRLNLDCGSGFQASPKSLSPISFTPGPLESLQGSGGSKLTLDGNKRGTAQGSRRGSLRYDGTHVDKNVSASPTLFPVLQYGGQYHGGLGVPAVLPGYDAQSHCDFGNSEMTWLPVLAGSVETLGAAYHSPYIAVGGGYNRLPSGRTSSIGVSINEMDTNGLNIGCEPAGRPEVVNEELRQRKIRPRRYSEMKFNKGSE